MVHRRYDPRRMLSKAADDVGVLLRAAHDVPLSLSRTLQKLRRRRPADPVGAPRTGRLRFNEFDRSSNRIVVGLITSSLVVASALIIRSGSASTWLMVPIFLLSGFLGIWLIYGILRSGRL